MIESEKHISREGSKYIKNLAEAFGGDIHLTFKPHNTVKFNDIKEFLKNHGKFITVMDFSDYVDSDTSDTYLDIDENIILSIPNVEVLVLDQKDMTGNALRAIGSLNNLRTLSLNYCDSVEELLKLPPNLKSLSVVGCKNLVKLPQLPTGLINLLVTECEKIETLPEVLPIGVVHLDLSGCKKLEKLPLLHSKVTAINLNGCDSLSDDARIEAFSLFLEQNFIRGTIFFKKFIKNQIKANEIIINTGLKKLTSPETNPDYLPELANFIYQNQQTLGLHEEHPLMQAAINIIIINDNPGEKNPFNLYKKLKELFLIPSTFQPEKTILDGIEIGIDMANLKALATGIQIKREDLPKNVTLEAFDALFNGLKLKIETGGKAAMDALEALASSVAEIETPISGDPDNLLIGYLKLESNNASQNEAKWRAVLANIFDITTEIKKGNFFSEQEEAFIKTMMGIQHCEGGKVAGIALSYERLDAKYRIAIK